MWPPPNPLPPKNSPLSSESKPSEIKCKRYRYIILNKADNLLLGGVLTFIKPETTGFASETAIREAAASAQDLECKFDPFNLYLIVTPIGKIYRKT